MARHQTMNVTGSRTVLWSALGVGVTALPAAITSPLRLVYNATASAPLGWYVVVPVQEAGVGDLVLARLPSSAATLAGQRQYLPQPVPILKRVEQWPDSWCVCRTACSGLIVSGPPDRCSVTVSIAG